MENCFFHPVASESVNNHKGNLYESDPMITEQCDKKEQVSLAIN